MHPPRRLALLATVLAPALTPRPTAARIETERLLSSQSAGPSGGATALFSDAGFDASRRPPRATRRAPPPPPTAADHAVAQQAADLLAAIKQGDAAAARGDYQEAAAAYGRGAADHPDLALADVARTRAALMRFQLGSDDAATLLALEDVEAVLRGRGEVHAAVAVVRYALKRAGAEAEFAAATALEPRWGDAGFVEHGSGWPPRMVAAWKAFDSLQ